VIPLGYRDANEASLSCEIIVAKTISREFALIGNKCELMLARHIEKQSSFLCNMISQQANILINFLANLVRNV
jgi:hypothetical protein